jgi:hypothetical protein
MCVRTLVEHNDVLGVALAQWTARDDSKAQPEIRQAVGTAMEAVDAMLVKLHAPRVRLVPGRVVHAEQANDGAASRYPSQRSSWRS